MRLLFVSHLYPPGHTAGTEVYTAELARRLIEGGHEVEVFCSEKDIARVDLRLHTRMAEGVRVHELVSNLYLNDFEQSWQRPEVDRIFGALLDRLQPELVHVHHLMYLSTGILAEVARRGIALVFTLHDFWLACPRFGQLVHADGSLCARVQPERCGSCLPSFEWRQTRLKRDLGRAIARVHSASGIDLGPMARRVERWLAGDSQARRSGEGESFTAPPGPEQLAWAQRMRAREAGLRERALECVDQFVAPSLFLRDWFLEWGIPRERITQLSTGVDLESFGAPAARARARAELHVAFLGTLVPIKGAHVLVEAWGRLTQGARARASLTLYGPRTHTPAYVRELESAAAALSIELAGPVERARVPEVLRQTDLLVVPSVWYENRPLVVLEALATRTPLLVSEPGGMSELVEEGVSGWRFPMGDAGALARRLEELIARPEALDALYREQPRLASWESLTEAQLALYADVLARREARS